MKQLLILLLFITMSYSNSIKNDIYIIQTEQIYSIDYKKDPIIGPSLTIAIKKEYWEPLYDYTLANIHKKIQIQIDDITVNPYISEPVFHKIQISLPEPFNLSQKLQALVSNKNQEINNTEENIFLEKMLKKYPNNLLIIGLLIDYYHTENTTTSSNKCIKLYESISEDKTVISLLENRYSQIFDCYTDLNETTKAMQILNKVEEIIPEEEHYTLLEKKAYLFQIEHNSEQSKEYYLKALNKLKQTNFLKNYSYLSSEEKQSILDIKNQEIRRLEEIIE